MGGRLRPRTPLSLHRGASYKNTTILIGYAISIVKSGIWHGTWPRPLGSVTRCRRRTRGPVCPHLQFSELYPNLC